MGCKAGVFKAQHRPVLQDTFLFNATVAENISYAKPDATMEK